MDRSFLTDKQVIEASRRFVCVRLATYEDKSETAFLEKIYRGRSGNLENTVFAVLSPAGKQLHARAGRGPSYRTGSQLALAMDKIIIERYPRAAAQAWPNRALPEMKSLDLALNVASCDGLPTICLIGTSRDELDRLRQTLISIAWSEEFAGQFVFASAKSTDDLRPIRGLTKAATGMYVLQPDAYGLSGKVIQQLGTNAAKETTARAFRSVLADYDPPEKNHRAHVQLGAQLGFKWETAVPVTDLQSLQATKRLWGDN